MHPAPAPTRHARCKNTGQTARERAARRVEMARATNPEKLSNTVFLLTLAYVVVTVIAAVFAIR